LEITFKNGRQHGLLIEWHENGQKKTERNYINGKEDGLATEWNEDGVVISEKDFVDESKQ